MRVYVDGKPFDLLPGMTVRHALIAAGRLAEVLEGNHARDEWGNELGLGGAISEGMKIFIRQRTGR